MGGEHPQVALALNNLANTVRAEGNFADAEPLLRRALEIFERNEAPAMQRAIVMSNLADVNVALERTEAATALFERSLGIREAELGEGHPRTAVAMVGLAALAETHGEADRAQRWAERALAISQGPNGVPDAHGRAAAIVATLPWDRDPAGARAIAQEARDALAARGEDGAREVKHLDQWLAEHPAEP